MKNFDEEYELEIPAGDNGREQKIRVSRIERAQIPPEERSFVIGGETFVYRSAVAPEAFKRWSMMVSGEFLLRDERGRPILDDFKQPVSTLTETEALEIFDATVVAFLEPGQEEKWKKVRDPEAENPVTLQDMRALVRWLFEEQSARPTGPPSGSSRTSETASSGTPSTVESSSPAATG
jgi:hypothetical protein